MFPTAVSLCAPPTLSCACNYLCFLFFLSACQALGLYCKYKDISLPLLDSPPHRHTHTHTRLCVHEWRSSGSGPCCMLLLLLLSVCCCETFQVSEEGHVSLFLSSYLWGEGRMFVRLIFLFVNTDTDIQP